jgi:hypothetical protein
MPNGPKVHEFTPPPIPPGLPVVYANGFVNNLGTSDISVILLVDAAPVLKMHMSYTTAKSLAVMLTEVVGTLEKSTSHNIMISADVEKGLRAYMSESK